MDIENLVYTFEKFAPEQITAKIIVGGFGVCNIKLIVNYIDVAIFGRGEGQINEVIRGDIFPNVWRKDIDPEVSMNYEMRQPQYLVKGEISIGCHNKCKYCQYTHIRKPLKNTEYNPGKGMRAPETDWKSIDISQPGRYVTALDGLTESTRLRVSKPILDKDIYSKLVNIKTTGTVNLKLYMIVGYPWETADTVEQDLLTLINLFKDIDKDMQSKVSITFQINPFQPEPLTPMQYEPTNIHVNWHNMLSGRKLYTGKFISLATSTTISGMFTVMKRTFIHRAEIKDIETFKKFCFDSRFLRMSDEEKITFLLKHNYIKEQMFGKVDKIAADYLRLPL
jgi:radical SAM superfamily enzyme YgiQ (UPF0313 family)